MDIELARTRKREIEEKLRDEITQAIDSYRNETGLGITGVSVNLVEVTTFESRIPESRVSSVALEVEPI